MVVKTDVCYFSELKIFPGHGSKFVRKDGKVRVCRIVLFVCGGGYGYGVRIRIARVMARLPATSRSLLRGLPERGASASLRDPGVLACWSVNVTCCFSPFHVDSSTLLLYPCYSYSFFESHRSHCSFARLCALDVMTNFGRVRWRSSCRSSTTSAPSCTTRS